MAYFKFTYPVEARFADLDTLRHVNHAAYITLLETARIHYFLDVMGLPSLDDLAVMMAQFTITYRAPIYFRERVVCGVRTTWIKHSSFGFAFGMWVETEQGRRDVAEGEGVHVWFDPETNRSAPLPEQHRRGIEAFEGDLPSG